MITYKNIIDDFSTIATNHYLINSFHSGKYRLMGYKHEITNNQAKTTLRIHKISLGDIK